MRNLTVQILENAGYTVLVACDGEEEVRLFGSHTGEVDLVLLDVVMPSLGGRAVYNHIRKSGAQTPVLFSSGYASDGVHTNFVLNEGMQLIQKPYYLNDLLRRVRQALDS